MEENNTVELTEETEYSYIEQYSEYLSEMDKIFIPKDLDANVNVADLITYRINIKGFKIVPENYALVKKNIFTQKNKNVKNFGFKFIAPLFTKTILVPKQSGIKKFKGVKVEASNREELIIDLNIVMKITDPALYIKEGKNKIEELTAIVNNLLRGYASEQSYEQLLRMKNLRIEDFDPENNFEQFEANYGIAIERVILEKIQLPENLKALHDNTVEELKKQQAQAIKNQTEKEKAATEAENIATIENAKNQVAINRITQLIKTMSENGFSSEQISSVIKNEIIAESGHAIFMGADQQSQNIASGIIASQIVDNKKTKQV